jgi:hypothetical protein
LARAGGGGPFINESVEAITGVPPVKGAYLVSILVVEALVLPVLMICLGVGYLLWYLESNGPDCRWCESLLSLPAKRAGISCSLDQILNMSDYTRFASKPKDQVLSQVIVVPVMGVSPHICLASPTVYQG